MGEKDKEFDIDDFSSKTVEPDTGLSVGKMTSILKNESREKDDENSSGDMLSHKTYCQWQVLSNDIYTSASKTEIQLPASAYGIEYINGKILFERRKIMTDDFLNFEDSQLDTILRDIEDFWNKKEVFKNYGFLHRRGILLYGPAGSGKTVLVQQALKNLISSGGLVVFADEHPSLVVKALSDLRLIEPERKIICVFEDLDAYVRSYSEETVLSLLDGERMTDNVLNIATTNYPERLDRRIVARPRRFDRVIKIGMPNRSMREMFFRVKLKIEGKELEYYVNNTEGFSFAAMTELVISVKCFDKNVESTLSLLREMMSTHKSPSSDEYYRSQSKPGFGA